MYKCQYSFKDKWYEAADYFNYPSNDVSQATAYYKTTKAYADVVLVADSISIEYYCTYTEWKNSN